LKKSKFVAIVGPTACGKTALALQLALRFHGEIISADSVQVYRGLDIGTAKPSLQERGLVPHHLIDIMGLDEDYSAALFRKQADAIIDRLQKEKTPVFVVGGTGLYLKALTRGLFPGPAANAGLRETLYKIARENGVQTLHRELEKVDPEAALRIHSQDRFRIVRALEVFLLSRKTISSFHQEHRFLEGPYQIIKIGISMERKDLYQRIESRVDEMIKMGWLEEVRTLIHQGYRPTLKPFQSLGYKHIVAHISGRISIKEAIDLIKRDTRRYAKRQLTWFKADSEIQWISINEENIQMIEKKIDRFLREDGME
jgi:tRNA dimethylallyltransferase